MLLSQKKHRVPSRKKLCVRITGYLLGFIPVLSPAETNIAVEDSGDNPIVEGISKKEGAVVDTHHVEKLVRRGVIVFF